MARDLKLEVVLQAIDRATRPIRAITQSSSGLGRQLKDTREHLKSLEHLQRQATGFKKYQEELQSTGTELQQARDKLGAYQRAMESHKATQQALGAEVNVHRRAVSNLQKALLSAKEPSAALNQQYLLARDRLTQLETGYRQSQSQMRRYKDDIAKTTGAVQVLNGRHQDQSQRLANLRTQLESAGISTDNLATHEQQLATGMEKANAAIQAQQGKLAELTRKQEALNRVRAQYERTQHLAGSMAAGGAAGLATGYAVARPLKGIVDAFAPSEDAATQLKVSMMASDGSVAEDFQKITDLANSIGDRLPGTTADFQNMMTMLLKQGISAKSVLGGTGEAAAYLGVQLKLPAEQAAELAANMQDATGTAEADMMSLMDTIQKTANLGVPVADIIQGFSKMSPAMNLVGERGLKTSQALAPLLAMMTQAGLAGESAGNAIRKVFQSGLDTKDMADANDMLKKDFKQDFQLDFTNGKGDFGGLENLFKQLEKLRPLNDEAFTAVVKKIFGDDAETLQVVQTMMDKGMVGYEGVVAKMQAQADLRMRVNEQLSTLSNTMEAAQGSWSNAMAEIGATIAPQLKELISGIGDLAVNVKDWVKEHPGLTAAIVKTAGGLALLLAVGGGLGVMLASFLGPIALVRYGLALTTIRGVSLGGVLLNLGKKALPLVATGLRMLGALAMANPILAVITGLALGATLIYANWDKLGPYFQGMWAEIKAGFSGGIGGIVTTLMNFNPVGLVYRAFAEVLNYLGLDLPVQFTEFGNMIVRGLVKGLLAGLGQIKGAITQVGSATIGWFKEKLGIHSPSRVFAELGGFTMQGLEQGLAGGEKGPLGQMADTAKRLAQAGAVSVGLTAAGMTTASPAISNAEPLRIDNRAPLGAARTAPASAQPLPPVTIQVYGAPGMSEQQLAQLVGQKVSEALAQASRANQARARSSLSDQD
jgi:TP901 family phage tail tape measure protein